MTKITSQYGRRVTLDAIVDRERNQVQIIRTLSNAKGFLVDSGNMGWMPLDEWRAFLAKQTVMASETPPTLMQLFGLDKKGESK